MKPIITIFNGPYPTANEELEARIKKLKRTARDACKARDLDTYLAAKSKLRRLERQRDYENLFAFNNSWPLT
jgi:hypothetical protein